MESVFHDIKYKVSTDNSYQHRLSILLQQGGFSYNIFHYQSKRLAEIGEYKSEFQNISLADIASNPIFDCQFLDVNILVHTSKFQLVPSELNETDISKKSLEFTNKISEAEEIYFGNINNDIAYTAAIPKSVVSTCMQKWEKPNIQCSNVAWLKLLSLDSLNKDNKRFFVNLNSKTLEIAFFQQNQIFYYNTFKYTTSEDVLYYLLFVLELMGYSPQDEELILTGKHTDDNDFINLFKTYFKEVYLISDFVELPQNINLTKAQISKYYTLLFDLRCE